MPERIVCVFELVEIHNDERVVPPLLQLKGDKVFRSDLVVDLREQIRACFVAEAVFLKLLVVDVRELPDELDGAPGFVTDAAEADRVPLIACFRLKQAEGEGIGIDPLLNAAIGLLKRFRVLGQEHVEQVVLMPPVIRDDPGLMENGFVAFRARHLVGVVVVFEDDVVGQLRDDAVPLLFQLQCPHGVFLLADVHEHALKYGHAVAVSHEAGLEIDPDDTTVPAQDAVFGMHRDVACEAGTERAEQVCPVVGVHHKQGFVVHVLLIFRVASPGKRVKTGVCPEHTEVVREFEPRHPPLTPLMTASKLLRGFSRPGRWPLRPPVPVLPLC